MTLPAAAARRRGRWIKFECKDGSIHVGRWVTLSEGDRSQHAAMQYRHEYEMVDHNLRECNCGRSQYIEWRRPSRRGGRGKK